MKVGPVVRHLTLILASAVAAFAANHNLPANFTQTAVLYGSSSNSSIGRMAASGNTVVVGDVNAGAVYVFVKPSTGWQNATQVATLTPSVPAVYFGDAVAVSGNTIVVGAPFANSDAGAAFVYVEPAGGWTVMTETAQLTGNSSFGLGGSVAVSGNTIVAGSTGRGYVYEMPSTGWADMTETAQLSNLGACGSGSPVAISGDTIIVVASGCCQEGQPFPGEADVFVKPSTGWATQTTPNAALMGSDEGADDFYGATVSMSGDTVVVGANYHRNQNGAAYVFVRSAQGWRSMAQTAELTATNGRSGDQFGNAVSIVGNMIVIGANGGAIASNAGAIYLYDKPASGWQTTSRSAARLFGQAEEGLGISVGIGTGVVFATGASVINEPGQGAVLVFGP